MVRRSIALVALRACRWDTRDACGAPAHAGVYWVGLASGDGQTVRCLVVLGTP